jgi:GTPase SAR1 family protein
MVKTPTIVSLCSVLQVLVVRHDFKPNSVDSVTKALFLFQSMPCCLFHDLFLNISDIKGRSSYILPRYLSLCPSTGGQEQYRSEWSRYTKGCDVVLYVVDAAAPQKFVTAKKELHKLLDDGSIGSTPLLVLANKIDIPEHAGEQELIEKLQLNYVLETPWMVLPISALHTTNIDQVVEWLTSQGK